MLTIFGSGNLTLLGARPWRADGILRHKQNVYENTKNHIDGSCIRVGNFFSRDSFAMVSGLRLGLPPFPFWGDTTFCIGIGAGLLMVQSGVKKERKFSSEQTASCNPAPQDT
jgi:hypothetical protein